jgi:hypothetical protein
MIQLLSPIFPSAHSDAALAGFLGLLLVTAANNMLSPMRDAAAMSCGVEHIPTLTFISTLLALCSSVPVGWLFEAPDPARRKFLAKVGLTRGETQGTSLALFYRLFLAACLVFAVAFHLLRGTPAEPPLFAGFYLLVHVMKLHSVSLVWNVTTEAMEYEEMTAVKQLPPAPLGLGDAPPQPLSRFPSTVPLPPPPGEQGERDERGSPNPKPPVHPSSSTSPLSPPAPHDPSSEGMRAIAKKRLASLGFVGLGGTLGQIIGSSLTATYANSLNFSGLLLMSALMLEVRRLGGAGGWGGGWGGEGSEHSERARAVAGRRAARAHWELTPHPPLTSGLLPPLQAPRRHHAAPLGDRAEEPVVGQPHEPRAAAAGGRDPRPVHQARGERQQLERRHEEGRVRQQPVSCRVGRAKQHTRRVR